MRQIQLDIIQELIPHDAYLERRPYHSAEELRNVGWIVTHGKRHHRFRTGTIPTCGERFLKENHLDPMIVGNFGRFTVRNMQSVQFDCRAFAKAMDDFALFEVDTGLFFNFGKYVLPS